MLELSLVYSRGREAELFDMLGADKEMGGQIRGGGCQGDLPPPPTVAAPSAPEEGPVLEPPSPAREAQQSGMGLC